MKCRQFKGLRSFGTFELLHDDKDPLRGLEHPLQVDDARVVQVLQDGNLVLQRSLLFRREAQLVNNLSKV